MTTSLLLQNIPCTLVTGFLGAGKTTVINQLLSTKPADARWALLINEFGRIGIDGALLTPAQDGENEPSNIAIREVSGGCICCTSQLPLQIAISRLLSEHRPQRLIIEPTGLAHPRELIGQLSAPHWQTALSMQAVITVLSGVQWQEERYRTHDGFQAHVRDADVLVVNRYEQLSASCRQNLQEWIATLNSQVKIIWAAAAPITPDTANSLHTYLSELTTQLTKPSHIISQQRTANTAQSRVSLTPPNNLMTRPAMDTGGGLNSSLEMNADNKLPYRYHDEQQGMLLAGWRLPPDWVFAAEDLQQWLLQLPHWQRIKGIVHTSDGWIRINFTPDSLTITTASAQIDSRLQIILLADHDTATHTASNHKRHSSLEWEIWDRELMALVI